MLQPRFQFDGYRPALYLFDGTKSIDICKMNNTHAIAIAIDPGKSFLGLASRDNLHHVIVVQATLVPIFNDSQQVSIQ
jgi:hypothetical protein